MTLSITWKLTQAPGMARPKLTSPPPSLVVLSAACSSLLLKRNIFQLFELALFFFLTPGPLHVLCVLCQEPPHSLCLADSDSRFGFQIRLSFAALSPDPAPPITPLTTLDSSSSSGSHHAHTQEVSGRQFKGKQEGQAQASGVCGQEREGGSPGATVVANVTPCLLDTKSPMGGLGL